MIILALLLSPVYYILRKRSNAYLCKKNFQSMSKSLQLYAEDNDQRMPPAYVTVDDKGTPLVENGAVYSWAYLLDQYMKPGTSFSCPEADPSENYLDHKYGSDQLMPVSYSFYKPYSGIALSDIPNPDEVIIIGESSNHGVFNPHPITGPDGSKLKSDGFVIGWSNGNDEPDSTVTAVTRLAYPDTENGKFDIKGASRHPDGNHFLTASGRAITLPPSAARVLWDSKAKKIRGRWAIPDVFWLNRQMRYR